MKKYLVLSVAILILACASTDFKPLPANKRLLTAVSDIKNGTGDSDFDFLSKSNYTSPYIHSMHSTGCFRLIERSRLKVILDEHKLSFSGLTDPSQSQKFGKILGVDAILYLELSSADYQTEENKAGTASYTEEELNVIISARLISVKTGEILATSQYMDTISNSVSTVGNDVSHGSKMNIEDQILKVITEDAPEEISYELAEQIYKMNKM